MKQVTDTISGRLTQLQKKYEDLRPFLDQINEIGLLILITLYNHSWKDEATRRMEQAVTTLETYLGALEAKLKKIQLASG